MELILAEPSIIQSNASVLIYCGVLTAIFAFIIARLKSGYSVKKAFGVALLPLLLFGYFSFAQRDLWWRVIISESELTLWYSNNTFERVAFNELVSTKPQPGRSGCKVIVRTATKTYSSVEIPNERCWQLARTLTNLNTL